MMAAPAVLVFDARTPDQACPPSADPGAVVVCTTEGRLATVVPVDIEGQPARLLIEPGGNDVMTCNPEFVRRARIAGRGPVRLANVGPVEVLGTNAEVRMTIADRAAPYRTA